MTRKNNPNRRWKHSIRYPLILLLLVISLVPLLCAGLFIIYRGATLARNQILEQELEYLENSSIRLDACMQDVESYFSSASAQENLQRYYYKSLDYSEYSPLITTQRMFRNFLEQQSLIESVYYVSFKDSFFIGSVAADYYTPEDTQTVLQDIINNHNTTFFWENIPSWDGFQRSMKKESVTIEGLTMFIKCPMYSNSTQGALLVTMSQEKLNAMLTRTESSNQIIIADETGKVQYAYEPSYVGSYLTDIQPIGQTELDGKRGNSYIRQEDGNYYINYLRGENDWLYLTVSGTEAIDSELRPLILVYTVLGAVIATVLISLAILIYRWLYNPIYYLVQKTGGLDKNKKKTQENEFYIIEEGVNSLLTQKQMMEKQLLLFQNSMKELFLIKLIRGLLQESEEIHHEGQNAGVDAEYPAMALLVFRPIQSNERNHTELIHLMEQIYSLIPLEQIITSTIQNGFQVVWLGGKCSVSEFLQELLELQNTVEHNFPEDILLVNSEVFTDFSQVRNAYYGAMTSFAYRSEKDESLRTSLTGKVYEHGFPEQLSEQLNLLIKNGSLEEAEQTLDRILKTIFRGKREPVIYQIYLLRLISSLLSLTEEPDIESEKLYQLLPEPLFEKFSEICDRHSAKKILFYEIIVPISEKAAENRKKDMDELGEKAVALIHTEFSLDLTLESCAEKLGCAPMHLWQVFREKNHVTFSQYLEDYRFQKAVERLVKTNDSVKEIAEELGYANSQNFIRSFKKKMGCTPGQYREKHL